MTAEHEPRPPARPETNQALETGRNRLVLVAALFALAFAVIAGRLVDLTVLRGNGGEPALGRDLAAATPPARRDIMDRRGVLLATNLTTASLYARPAKVLDVQEAARRLAAVLPELDAQAVAAKLATTRGFVWIKRHLTPRQQYRVNALGLPGLGFQRESRRIYPHGNLFAHVLGYTGVDNRGLAGLEKHFDEELAGGGGGEADQPLRLGLDTRVQHVLHGELNRALEEFRARGASGLVLDVDSAEVVALVSLPDFDPNRLNVASAEARFNRATLGVYEMGSTFKALTVAMALEAGVGLNQGFDARKPIRVARFTIRDDHAKARWLTLPEIFIYSSNIGAAKMALKVGTKSQRQFLGDLGLLQRAAIELPEVGMPLVPRPWREISTMTVAFGHGVAVSPLQLANAVAALINGGLMRTPTLLAREGEVPGRRVVSRRTSDVMRWLMRLNVEQGTGKKAAAPGYLVGGKTGSAEKVAAGGYRQRALLSSFVGAFPMKQPRYVVLAVLDEPQGRPETFGYATGGWTAAPVVGRVIARAGPLLGIGKTVDETPDTASYVSFKQTAGRRATF
ncbi:MAG: penicillin-binding protein 2 [Alphaproteobacteria bacterium]|nr:penicillin-binding protein 2 [Alphaproteobacteria bacterium]